MLGSLFLSLACSTSLGRGNGLYFLPGTTLQLTNNLNVFLGIRFPLSTGRVGDIVVGVKVFEDRGEGTDDSTQLPSRSCLHPEIG